MTKFLCLVFSLLGNRRGKMHVRLSEIETYAWIRVNNYYDGRYF